MNAGDVRNNQTGGTGALYDEQYYANYHSESGLPYDRTGPWLSFFAGMADKIVQTIKPRTALDVGCAKGFLVEALRDRGVEAFGLDISEYAIGRVREDIKPYCWVGSVLESFPRCYDLIVCIEVLEHLPAAEAELAVDNLCRHADDILFSSTPDDFTEPTHCNVQPVEYWAEIFARHGFYRDVDFDAAFVAEHGGRFRKAAASTASLVQAYERSRWAQCLEARAQRRASLERQQCLTAQLTESVQAGQRLFQENQDLAKANQDLGQEKYQLERQKQESDALIESLQRSLESKDALEANLWATIREIESSLGWRLLSRFSKIKQRWLPPQTRRRVVFDGLVRRLKGERSPGVPPGYAALLRKAATRARLKLDSVARSQVRRKADRHVTKVRPAGSWGSRVLMISGSLGTMERYRCVHAQEQIELYGFRCDVIPMTNLSVPLLVPEYDLVILHRVPRSEFIDAIVQSARSHQKIVVFDVDDLVFDSDVLGHIDALQYMEPAQRALYEDGVVRYRGTLELCDAAIVSTDYLVQAVSKFGKPAWVHRNALNFELLEISERAFRARPRASDKVVIGYASGTRTHNRDFREVEPALERILETYPQTEVWILGYLDLADRWSRWAPRVKRVPFVPWRELPHRLAQLDINLAPLEMGNPFCLAKSELKYIEAAAVGVPTVSSAMGSFEVAIRSGDNGVLVKQSEEWFAALEQLVRHPTLREAMGARARADTLRRYHPATRGAELLSTLEKIVEGVRETKPTAGVRPGKGEAARVVSRNPKIFPEHQLAHALLDGLTGLEIGAAAHNPFGLRTRNVALPEVNAFYAEHARREMELEPAPIDIEASGDAIPVPDRSEDFVISSHVVEHLPNLVAAFVEWNRIVKDRGYVFMIAPLKGALPADASREVTPLTHFVQDFQRGITVETHPVDGVPGGKAGHYHVFTPDSLSGVVEWMCAQRLCDWELVAREDIDSKVGNGFTLAYRVRHAPSSVEASNPMS
jgi:glycosyltransferase involved in cell wall biosynthesis/2-polyprenyl-3-methyl-5-hydroxy-6-metoxy-1,4-benzoquinol methylase